MSHEHAVSALIAALRATWEWTELKRVVLGKSGAIESGSFVVRTLSERQTYLVY